MRTLNTLNNFGKNLNFTVDTFDDAVPHFLDTEIHPMASVFIAKTQI